MDEARRKEEDRNSRVLRYVAIRRIFVPSSKLFLIRPSLLLPARISFGRSSCVPSTNNFSVY